MTTAQEARERYLQRIDGRLRGSWPCWIEMSYGALPSQRRTDAKTPGEEPRQVAGATQRTALLPSELLDEVAQRLLRDLNRCKRAYPTMCSTEPHPARLVRTTQRSSS